MTPKELVARMPEDFTELIGRFIADPDINTDIIPDIIQDITANQLS